MKAPAVEMSLSDPIATHDQERSLVQRLFKGKINAESFDQAYAYVWPRQRLTETLLKRFSDSSPAIRSFWLAQERRELLHSVLPGETVQSNYQDQKLQYYRASSMGEIHKFRMRLHREITRGETGLLSFDLESKIRSSGRERARVWLALFGVPDGFIHVVDLRDNKPGKPTKELDLRETMGSELVELFEERSIVIGTDVKTDCRAVGLAPQRMLATDEIAFSLYRSALPRGEVEEIASRSGIACFGTLIHGFHLKKLPIEDTRPIEEVAMSHGLWGWPYVNANRRAYSRIYSWPRDLRGQDATRFRLYCWLDVVTPIDVVLRYVLQRLTEEGSKYSDAPLKAWIEMILSGAIKACPRPLSPADPPFGGDIGQAEGDGELEVWADDQPPVDEPVEAAAKTDSRSRRRAKTKKSKARRERAASSSKSRESKEEKKQRLAEYRKLTNKPAPLRVVRDGDSLRPVPDARAVSMPGGVLSASSLWWGFSGDPHDGLLAGVSRHIFQLELVYATLPPLFHVLRKVLTKITGIELPERPHQDYSIWSEERLHKEFGIHRLFDLVMPGGYNEDWKDLPLDQRIENEVADLLALRMQRHDGDQDKLFKVDRDYLLERECNLGEIPDDRHCRVCGSPRHGWKGESCLLTQDRKYFLFREARDGQLCSYPLCTDRGSHLTTTCPTLSSRCPICACRGHPEEFCPGKFWEKEAELECLRTLFEAYADLSLETDRRMITPRNRPTLEKMAREGTRIRLRPSAGFHCISLNTPLGCFDYADLLNRPIHRAQVHLVEILLQNEVEPILEPEEFRSKYGCSHRDGKGFRRALGISESFATQPPSLLKFLEEHRSDFRRYNAEKAEASRRRCLEINRKRKHEEEKVDDELDREAPTPSPPPTS